MTSATIPGYRMGDSALQPSSLTPGDLGKIQQALLFGEDDLALLRAARPVVEPQLDALLDTWYGFVGDHDFLLAFFSTSAGPDGAYLDRVRARFGQWVLDLLDGNYDAAFLAYQAEVGRRHAPTKNATDNAAGTPDAVSHRYLTALVYPIHATMRPVLAAGIDDADTLEATHQAWLKAVLLSVTLWSEAYVRPGWF